VNFDKPTAAPDITVRKASGSFSGKTGFSNRVFKSFDDIVDHCNASFDHLRKIMSIAQYDWGLGRRFIVRTGPVHDSAKPTE
jgi:hypothetical protein